MGDAEIDEGNFEGLPFDKILEKMKKLHRIS